MKCCDFRTKLGDYKNTLIKTCSCVFVNKKQQRQQSNEIVTICQHKNMEQHKCKYCDKCFKHRQSMYRHIKYYCKKSKDEGIQEYKFVE